MIYILLRPWKEGRKDICSQESVLWHCVLKRPFAIAVIEHLKKHHFLKFKFLRLVSDSLLNDFMYIYEMIYLK